MRGLFRLHGSNGVFAGNGKLASIVIRCCAGNENHGLIPDLDGECSRAFGSFRLDSCLTLAHCADSNRVSVLHLGDSLGADVGIVVFKRNNIGILNGPCCVDLVLRGRGITHEPGSQREAILVLVFLRSVELVVLIVRIINARACVGVLSPLARAAARRECLRRLDFDAVAAVSDIDAADLNIGPLLGVIRISLRQQIERAVLLRGERTLIVAFQLRNIRCTSVNIQLFKRLAPVTLRRNFRFFHQTPQNITVLILCRTRHGITDGCGLVDIQTQLILIERERQVVVCDCNSERNGLAGITHRRCFNGSGHACFCTRIYLQCCPSGIIFVRDNIHSIRVGGVPFHLRVHIILTALGLRVEELDTHSRRALRAAYRHFCPILTDGNTRVCRVDCHAADGAIFDRDRRRDLFLALGAVCNNCIFLCAVRLVGIDRRILGRQFARILLRVLAFESIGIINNVLVACRMLGT